MYNWRTIRTLVVLLLCLPLVQLALTGGSALVEYLTPSPEVWRAEMQTIAARDESLRLPTAPILVTGGRSVRLWETLPKTIASRPLITRPLGDATLEDLTYHYERLIGFYRPSVLVVLPSYSNFYLRDSQSPAEFAEALRELLTLNESMGVSTRRYVITPVVNLLQAADRARMAGIRASVAEVARSLPNTTALDPNPLLAGADGDPDPRYFRFGGLYLNDEGYAVLTGMLRRQFAADGMIDAVN